MKHTGPNPVPAMPVPTLQELSEKLDSIHRYAVIAAKPVLNMREAADFTSLSVSRLYTLTSTRAIPHYKNGKKIYFAKSELEQWLLRGRVKTTDEVDSEAATYLAKQRITG